MLPFVRMLEYGNNAPVPPVPIEPRLTSSDYSSNFSFVKDGKLYLTGSNDFYQLGITPQTGVYNEWIKVPSSENVLLCSTGYSQTIYVTISGSVYIAGNDITVSPTASTTTWKDISSRFNAIDMSKIKDISIDRYGVMVIAEDDSVWAIGTDNTGWSGQGIMSVGFFSFKQIYNTKPALRVFSGTGTSRILLQDGTILSSGQNASHQCNASTIANVLSFTESFPGIDTTLIYQYKICNNNCMIFLGDKRYYATGSGSYGVFGDGVTSGINNKFYSGTLSVAPMDQRIFRKFVSSANASSSLYIGEDGWIYSCGYDGVNLINASSSIGIFTKCKQSTVPYSGGYLCTGSSNSLVYKDGRIAVSSPSNRAPTVAGLVPTLGMGGFANFLLPS
ncbi:BNR repeat domain protein [Escherichia phage EJP2]|nr:BNR repeat domain protein [Escherichia phage EJP2]